MNTAITPQAETTQRHLPNEIAQRNVVMLHATYARAVAARKRQASEGGVQLNVEHTTAANWLADAWELWGDERRIIGAMERQAFMMRALQDTDCFTASPGTANALSSFASHYAGEPWFERMTNEADTLEGRVAGVCATYYELLGQAGLIELGNVPGALHELDAPAGSNDTFIVAGDCLRGASQVMSFFESRVQTQPESIGAAGAPNAVSHRYLMSPSGPIIENAILAHQLCHPDGALKGCQTTLVVCDEPAERFAACRERLSQHGIQASCIDRQPFALTTFGSAIAATVAMLSGQPGWREAASDLAASRLMGLGHADAQRFDATMRSHRGFVPVDSDRLLSELAPNYSLFRSVAKGEDVFDDDPRILEVRALLARHPLDALAESAAIDALLDALRIASACGLGRQAAFDLLDHVVVPRSLGVDLGRDARSVVFCSTGHGRNVLPASVDAVVFAGATDDVFPAAERDTSLTLLAKRERLPERPSRTEVLRDDVMALAHAARTCIVVSTPVKNDDGSDAYPAFFVRDLLESLPGKESNALLGETKPHAWERLTVPFGEERLVDDVMAPKPQGRLSLVSAERGTVVDWDSLLCLRMELDANGVPRPVLSPSQMENYASCPYKWFLESKVNPSVPDQGFSALEQGEFAHAALQRFFERFAEAGFRTIDANDLPHAQELFDQVLDDLLAEQTPESGVLVPVDAAEEQELRRFAESLRRFVQLQRELPDGFEVEGCELELPREPRVPYAGALLNGRLDRLDVNPHEGTFAVIDYKGSTKGMQAGLEDSSDAATFQPPSKVQALVYAQAMARRNPALRPVAAVYLAYRAKEAKGMAAGSIGAGYPARELATGASFVNQDFQAFLDAVERGMEPLVARMLQGHVAPNPAGRSTCSYCPAIDCPGRLS